MDAQVITDEMKMQEKTFSGKNSGKSIEVVTHSLKDFVGTLAMLENNGNSLEPTTPDSFPVDSRCLLAIVSSPPERVLQSDHHSSDSSDSPNCSPRTPKEGVFDPFAPGPEDLVLAPLCKKNLSETRLSVARRLDFDSSYSSPMVIGSCGNIVYTQVDDGMLLQSFYDDLLDLIFSVQMDGALADGLPPNLDSDGYKTPTSVPCLNGIAETCPGAPRKRTSKLLNVDLGLCRKLEF